MTLSAALRRAVDHFESSAAPDYGDETVALPADYFVGSEEPPRRHRRRRAEAADYDEIYLEEERPPLAGSQRAPTPLALVGAKRPTFCLLMPQTFNDAQQIADRFRSGAMVICDLQGREATLARRLSDFCSGLVYALQGNLELLDERVLLLAPHDVELSGRAAADALAKGFFNHT